MRQCAARRILTSNAGILKRLLRIRSVALAFPLTGMAATINVNVACIYIPQAEPSLTHHEEHHVRLRLSRRR